MPKKPTIELPKFVQRIINGGREYFYFQEGAAAPLAEPTPETTEGST